ncbi:MAG: DUF6348 family protein [Cyanobacteria bacterium J06648_16]
MKREEWTARELKTRLTQLETSTSVQQNQLKFDQWPTLCIKVLHVSPIDETQNSTVLQFQIQTQLNVEHSDSFLMSHCTGIGSDLSQAIQDGVNSWMRSEAPLIFSLLRSHPVQQTEWFSNGDPLGIPGWDLFSSPYIIRGIPTSADILRSFIQNHPLLTPIRQDLPQFLDRQRMLHLVSIYHGVSGGKHFADCRINGEVVSPLNQILLLSDWPLGIIEWASVRQSLLLLSPPSG